MSLRVYKIGARWRFSADGHVGKGYPTKDAAQLAGEKYLVEKRKAAQKARREALEQEKQEAE